MPGVDPISAGIAAAQGVAGIIQTVSANSKIKKLLAQRKAYKTPEEYFDILHATQSLAQQGYDPVTLNYLTNQTERAFSSGLSAATRLGADPNQLSALLDQKMQASMKIGAENAALNMQNFSKYLSALDVIGQNKAAEWSSQQDIIKDKLQAASADKAAGIQNIGSAANAAIALSSAAKVSDLYNNIPGISDGVSFLERPQGLLKGATRVATAMSPGNPLLTNIPFNPATPVFMGRIEGLAAYLNRPI